MDSPDYPEVDTTVKETPKAQAAKSVSAASESAIEKQKEKNARAKGIAGSILTSKGTGSGGMATTENSSEKSKTLG